MRGILLALLLALLPTIAWLTLRWLTGMAGRRRRRPRQKALGSGRLEIKASPDGNYRVRARINGQPVDLVVDTGASTTILNLPGARRARLELDKLDFNQGIDTANGAVPDAAAEVMLDSVALGPLRVAQVPALVSRAPLSENLLGLDFLKALKSFTIRDGILHLEQ